MSDLRPYGLLKTKEQKALQEWGAGFEVFNGTKWSKATTLNPAKVYRRIYKEPSLEAFEDAPAKADTVLVDDDNRITFYDSERDHYFSEKGENEGWEPNIRIQRVQNKFVRLENDDIEFMEEGINTKSLPTITEIHQALNELNVGDNVIILRNFSKRGDYAYIPYSNHDEELVNKLAWVKEVKSDGIVLNNGKKYPFWCLEKVDYCPECDTQLGPKNEHIL